MVKSQKDFFDTVSAVIGKLSIKGLDDLAPRETKAITATATREAVRLLRDAKANGGYDGIRAKLHQKGHTEVTLFHLWAIDAMRQERLVALSAPKKAAAKKKVAKKPARKPAAKKTAAKKPTSGRKRRTR